MNEERAVGGHEECTSCGRRFRVVDLHCFPQPPGMSDVVALGDQTCDNINDNPYIDQCWSYWSDYRHASADQRTVPHAEPPPADSPSADEAKWLEALDEAIARVTTREYRQLKRQDATGSTARLECAFKSIEKLQKGEQPCYDRWDALLYVSWYQPRQVHLAYAVLKQHPPPPSSKPLRIVDFGCGAWAVSIALAMFAAGGHPALRDRKVSIHGIESKEPMWEMGQQLWHECLCAAEKRGLNTGFARRMSPGGDAYLDRLAADASAETWLLAIHALYDESQRDVGSFLDRYRERLASGLRYQLLTTHGSKLPMLESIVGVSGEWISPPPIWNGTLGRTTKCRRKIHEELRRSGSPMSGKYMRYLWNRVSWNPRDPGTPIEKDAVWVRGQSSDPQRPEIPAPAA